MSHHPPADPFVTKGIEYLLVLGFLPALALFWRLVRGRGRAAPRPAAATVRFGSGRWFDVRPGAYYHPGHSWALPEEGDVVRVGMDDFAQKLVGTAQRIELPAVGERLAQGASAWKLRIGSKSVDLLSPVDGVVVERNEAALAAPEVVNRDPYGDGWLLKVRTSRLQPNLRTLIPGDLARAWMDVTLEALQRRMQGDLGVVLQDGGMPVAGMARALSPEAWDEVARDFFLTH